MLSVNIPVYNVEVVGLVKQLIIQANAIKIEFEIRVYDDGSDEIIRSINKNIARLPHVVYTELKQNLGRAAIRNKMGLESKFQYLLFIDADSKLVNENYLQNFLYEIKPGHILCGGTAYANVAPGEQEKYLRWYYGKNREAISAKKRMSHKGFIITSNNFMIEKDIFEKVHFRENIKDYGHEDTLLGYDLFNNQIQIKHIDNPVEHTGLESAHHFLQKSKMALKNLKMVSEVLLDGDKNFIRQVNFLNKYRLIKTFLPKTVLQWYFKKYQERMEMNLKGENPGLKCFDLYKLSYYSTL